MGVNPAHALYWILTRPWPQGRGISEDHLILATFENAGETLFNEKVACNIYAKDGVSAAQVVANILQEHGFTLAQIGDKLGLVPVRKVTGTVPEFTNDVIIGGLPERKRDLSRVVRESVIFTFDNAKDRYRRGDVPIFSDANITANEAGLRTVTRQLETITDRQSAYKTAQRLYLTDLVQNAGISITVGRDAAQIFPGQVFRYDGVQWRCVSRTPTIDRGAKINAVLDIYSVDAVSFDPGDPPPGGGGGSGEEVDFAFAPFELPADLAEEVVVSIARIRGDDQTTGGGVWMSPDNTDYIQLGSQEVPAAGGELESSLEGGGPIFLAENSDVDAFTTTISEALWLAKTRLCLINGELAAFRYLEDMGNDRYRIVGLLQGIWDSIQLPHSANDIVFLFNQSDQSSFIHSAIKNTTYWKTRPDGVDLGDVTEEDLTIRDRYLQPRPVDAFEASGTQTTRTLRNLNTYGTGDDITFSWLGRNFVDAIVPYGDIWNDDDPGSEGTFRVDIYDGSTFKRSLSVSADVYSVAYDNADLVSDFSGEPSSFTARCFSIVDGIESEYREIEVTLL